jgi:PEP-CTERM motif
VGAFANVANGARLNVTNLPGSFPVNYGAGSPFGAQNVVLSAFAIPEPSSALSLVVGLGALGIRRRRSASP